MHKLVFAGHFRNLALLVPSMACAKNAQQWGIAVCGGNGFYGDIAIFGKFECLWSNTYPERGEAPIGF